MARSKITKEIVDWYLDQGFALIPINKKHGKRPLHNDWTKKEYTREQIYRFAKAGFNLGWRIPKGVCVVDIDPRNGGDAKQMFDQFPIFGHASFVGTGGHEDGRHIYLKIDEDAKIKEQIPDFPGVEFKTNGRQVIIPGSVHPDTKRNYVFVSTSENTPSVPKELLEKLSYKPKDSTDTEQKVTNEELKEILNQIPVEEYSTNDDWFNLMASAHGATDGGGVKEFVEWSISDPNYIDDEEIIRQRWDSLDVNSGQKRTLGSLIQELLKHGGELPKSISSKSDFDDKVDFEEKLDINALLDEIDVLPPDAFSEDGLKKYFAIVNSLDDNILETRIFKALKSSLGVTLQNIRDAYKKYKKTVDEEIFSESESIDFADLIATRVLEKKFHNGEHLLHANNQQFYRYNGKYWEPVKDNMIDQIIYQTGKEILATTDYDFKVSSLLASTQKVLIAKTATGEDLLGFEKTPPSVINTLNYELWINGQTGKVRKKKHSHTSYLTHCIDVKFDIDSKCPVFDEALEKMFCNAKNPKDMIKYLWEIFGYILQSKKNLAAWFLFHGHGNNGKSFVIDVLCKLLGPHMVLPRNIAEFDSSNGNAHALASLPSKLLILDDDLRKDTRLPDGTLKKLSEAKFLEANPKGKDTFNLSLGSFSGDFIHRRYVLLDMRKFFLHFVHFIERLIKPIGVVSV